MDNDLTYHEVREGLERIIAPNKFAKAEVFVASLGGQPFIVKDFAQKGFWERNLIGRIVTSRECRAYRQLAGIGGIPARFLRVTPFTLAIEYLDGRDLGRVTQGEIGPDIVRQLERIINDLHHRGWVHLDLQRRSNILLVEDRVFVVDLASAVHPGGVPVLGGLLTVLLGFADRLSLLKMKTLFAPELLTPGDRRLLRYRNFFMPTKW